MSGRSVLIMGALQMIGLWDLRQSPPQMSRQYYGQQQGHHIIKSSFGGEQQNLIVSGSEGTCKCCVIAFIMRLNDYE
jgi:hypothetical protein